MSWFSIHLATATTFSTMTKLRHRRKRELRGIKTENAEKNTNIPPKSLQIRSDHQISSGTGNLQSAFGPPDTGFNIKGAAKDFAPPWTFDYPPRDQPYQNSRPDLIDVNSIPIGRDRGFFTNQKENIPQDLRSPESMAPHHPRQGRNGPPPGRRDQPFSRPKRDGPQRKEFPRRQYPPAKESAKEDPKPIVDPVPDFDVHAVGPHPGVIEPCRRYVFESRIQKCLKTLGTESKDEAWKIQGVTFIDQMRKSLEL
jgi:hypothetical protein